MVLENNRNGRTKCYSTSAAALNGPKKSNQSPVKVPMPPLVEPNVEAAAAMDSEVAPTTENCESQQTNGRPLHSHPPTTTTTTDLGPEALEATQTTTIAQGGVSSTLDLQDPLLSMSSGKEAQSTESKEPEPPSVVGEDDDDDDGVDDDTMKL